MYASTHRRRGQKHNASPRRSTRWAGKTKKLESLSITHTHTHTRPFKGPFSGTTQVGRYQKGKPIWILLKQETVSGSGISWATCMSALHSRQITTPAPHHSFLKARCPSCHPTNSVKALKAKKFVYYTASYNMFW